MKSSEFSGAHLRDALGRLGIADGTALCVGYSGGRDSRVLLQALVDLAWRPLRALHVNHKLQPDADAWAGEARAVCAACDVSCTIREVRVTDRRRLGTEAAARAARYAVFREELAQDEVLVLAHHADDQAETVLLQLLRGAGIEGLMGMAPIQTFGRGRLARPLLRVSGDAIADFARRRDLRFIIDPSNSDKRYRRNFLRHDIMPRLQQYWPRATQAIGRSARQLQRAQAVWQAYDAAEQERYVAPDGSLQLGAWRVLDAPRALHVLRLWIRGQGGQALSERSLLALDRALRAEPASSQQRIALTGGVVRRHKMRAWWGDHDPGPSPTETVAWQPPAPLYWPAGRVRWSLQVATGKGLAQARVKGKTLRVRFRRAGEIAELPGRGHRSIKKLLQELGIPPWRRGAVPLVWDGERLVAVGTLWIAPVYRAADTEAGWVIEDNDQHREVVKSETIC